MDPSRRCVEALRSWAPIAILLTGIAIASGCATVPRSEDGTDPLQNVNRSVFTFNERLDKAIIKPAADAYVRVTPKPVRTAVSNFFDNISYVDVILNDFLQAKVEQGFSDVGRFLVNSTVGILGLFDVASELGMKPHQEDFGQTLGVWGSGEGAYLVYPILGPSTVRDTPGLVVSFVTNLLFYVGETAVVVPLTILAAIDARARAQGFFQFMDEAALDRYLFVREGYRQRRLFLIHDGRPPLPRFPEEADDEALAPGRK
jgi:phospholipid-binding lipoprotein MlaA